MKNILEVKNLNKTVKDFKILNDITFSVPEGKICGFIGHNGAGKTTTIKSILSLFKYETGEIFIDGISSKKICASHKIIGYVPEKENFPKIKTITFLKMMADMYDISDAEFKKRLAYFTRVFSLKHQLNRNLNNLSSGEKKKIMITQALLHKPRLLIMDEPTENLDPDTRDIFYAILNKISKQ
jgi:ABC-2 type transport system ATP-binding protein